MQAEKTAGLRRARLLYTMAQSFLVLAIVLHILELNVTWGRLNTWLACLGAAGACLVLFVVAAPVCRDCKWQIWNLLARSHVCCFMEKAAMKNAMLRSFGVLGWFFLGAGMLTGLEPRMEQGLDRYASFLDTKLRSPAERELKAQLEAAEAAYRAEKGSVNRALDLIELLVRTSQDGAALAVVEEALAAHPDDPDLKLQKALRAGSLGNTPLELELLAELAAARDKDAEVLFCLARARLKAGQAKEAEDAMRASLNAAVDDLKRMKTLYKLTEANLANTPDQVKVELDGLKFRAGSAAYQLALMLGIRKEQKEREQLLKLSRDLGIATNAFDNDLKALGGS